MKKKVLYFIHALCRTRVIKTFREDPDLEQMVVGPKPVVYGGVCEDYSGFGIKNIQTYSNPKEAQKIINRFAPDVVVQTDMMKTVTFPNTAKRVFVMHGLIGDHVRKQFKPKECKAWKGFDLYCGATEEFETLVRHAGEKTGQILLNSLPQLDLFHKDNYEAPDRKAVLKKIGRSGFEKIILFCGFCCKDRIDYNLHNEDYFKVVAELGKIAAKHNWLILVKPRQDYKEVRSFVVQKGWSKSYGQMYADAQKDKHLYFIPAEANIYPYFFADLIVCNGCSTVELEACLVHKPLVIVRTKLSPDQYDPFGTVKFGAGIYVPDIINLESAIMNGLGGVDIVKQDAFVRAKGIVVDGLAHKRIQEKIKTL